MKAIKINSRYRTVAEVDIDGGWQGIVAQIGNGCRMVTVAGRLVNGDVLYVDDEGMINLDVVTGFSLQFGDQQVYFAGNAVILGVDEHGDSAPAKSILFDVKQAVGFFDLEKR